MAMPISGKSISEVRRQTGARCPGIRFWDGSSFRGRRAFAAAMLIENGAPVTIDADTIRVSVTSSD